MESWIDTVNTDAKSDATCANSMQKLARSFALKHKSQHWKKDLGQITTQAKKNTKWTWSLRTIINYYVQKWQSHGQAIVQYHASLYA